MDAVIPEIKKSLPNVQRIHYWTDSPSSQYRNQFIFHVLANHRKLYQCDAQWNYFEASHGKSACASLEGTTKRMADEACRQGHVMIQNAMDFYKWGQQSSMKEVDFLFVEKSKCDQKQTDFANLKIKLVKNTMQLHAIASDPKDTTILRTHETSCLCESCNDKSFCRRQAVVKYESARSNNTKAAGVIAIHNETTDQVEDETEVDKAIDVEQCNVENNQNTPIEHDQSNERTGDQLPRDLSVFDHLNVGDYVAARYDENIYVGKVQVIDRDEGDCQINFMEKAKELYRWPTKKDILWVEGTDILIRLQEPLQTGKSRRLFKIRDEEKALITSMIQES